MSGAAQLPAYSPRTFSQVLDRIYRILRMDFRTQFGIAVVPGIGFFVSYGILLAVMWFTLFPAGLSGKQPPSMPQALVIVPAFIGMLGVHLTVLALYFAAASYAAVNADCGSTVTIRDAYQIAWERASHFICLILSLYGVCFLPALVVQGCIFGLVMALAPSRQFPPILMVLVPLGVVFLFAALIAGVIVALRLSLAFSASVFEFLGIRESIKRSWELTRGAAGRIFLIILVVYAVMYIAIMVMMMVVMFVALLGYIALSGMFAHPGPHTIQILIACGAAAYLGLISILSACTFTGFATSLSIIYNDQRLKMAASLSDSAPAGAQGLTFLHRAWIAGLIASVSLSCATASAQVEIPEPQKDLRWRDVSIGDYGQHLITLESLVEGCAKARDVKSCDPALVGPDDRVSISVGGKTEPRLIRYGWLRVLFVKAEDPDEKAASPSASKGSSKQVQVTIGEAHSTTQLLKDAAKRLERDLAQLQLPPAAVPNYTQERAVMREVLAGKDFQYLQEDTVSDSILEKLGNWLNRLVAGVANLKARSAWIGRVIVWGFILGVCSLLGYSLLRLERRWRLRLTPEDDQRPAPGAASARDWQLWLEDARRAAASGRWREAIHFLYWASISRLESRRLWPADRARTPREYLALVAQEDPRKAGLSQLTGAFERFWYGGRAAGENDYRTAESLAKMLIDGRAPDQGSLAAEDGAR